VILRDLESDEQFIGKEIICASQKDKKVIEELGGRKMGEPCIYLSRLIKFGLTEGGSVCSYQSKFHLVFEQEAVSLKEEKSNRQFASEGFTES
jgi:hypothetical protein